MTQEKICRICFQDSQPLVSLCNCQGTVGYLHQQCFLEWAEADHRRHPQKKIVTCQICLKQIPTKIALTYKVACVQLNCTFHRALRILLAIIIFLTLGSLVYFASEIEKALREKTKTEEQIILYRCLAVTISFGLIVEIMTFIWYFLIQKTKSIELTKPKGAKFATASIVPVDPDFDSSSRI